jgi:hypothetical protein
VIRSDDLYTGRRALTNIIDMTNKTVTAEASVDNAKDAENDLMELEFTPMSSEDTLTIGDRDYLFGTHSDLAVRP